MKLFSFEVPVPHLAEFDEYQNYYLLLVHLLKDPYYLMYALQTQKDPRLVILDNSFNELDVPTSIEELVNGYHMVQPDLVVAPDCNQWSTKELVENFEGLCKYVPQNRVLCLYRSIYERGMLEYSGCSHFGSSFWWRNTFHKDMPPKDFRFGFLDFDELNEDFTYIDTGMPIKIAKEGMNWWDWQTKSEHIHTRDDPSYLTQPLTIKQIKQAKRNIEMLKKYPTGGHNEGNK